MSQTIVIMGGSFNPPTKAHLELMLAAVNAVHADAGIYVPSSHVYVQKKMDKANHPDEVLDADLRLQMLCRMAEEDPRLSVDDHEYHETEKSRTFHTMTYFRERYPDAELLFLAGGDKLDIFPRWYRIKDFLEQFRIIVTSREGYDAAAALAEHPFLSAQRDRFVVIDYPAGIEGISSSAVREAWRSENPEVAAKMLHPAVYQMMRAPTDYVINVFRGPHFFLSNFYEAPVSYRGLTYRNTEAAFQAQKCLCEEEKLPFTEMEPSRAKNMGRRVKLRPDWEDVKLSLMEEIVTAKFEQNAALMQMLLDTGSALLKEGNTWNDVFWGVSRKTGRGENHLGRILMRIREKHASIPH